MLLVGPEVGNDPQDVHARRRKGSSSLENSPKECGNLERQELDRSKDGTGSCPARHVSPLPHLRSRSPAARVHLVEAPHVGPTLWSALRMPMEGGERQHAIHKLSFASMHGTLTNRFPIDHPPTTSSFSLWDLIREKEKRKNRISTHDFHSSALTLSSAHVRRPVSTAVSASFWPLRCTRLQTPSLAPSRVVDDPGDQRMVRVRVCPACAGCGWVCPALPDWSC